MPISLHQVASITLVSAACSLLVACGGGNDDDPTPSDQPGVLTVSNATVGSLNGVYGNGTLNLTDVEKRNPVGSEPEVCTFKYDGANKVGSSATGTGDIRYQPNATGTYKIFLSFDGKEYASAEAVDSAVLRDRNQIRFTSKVLTATDGSTASLRVSGIVPMRSSRPSGC